MIYQTQYAITLVSHLNWCWAAASDAFMLVREHIRESVGDFWEPVLRRKLPEDL